MSSLLPFNFKRLDDDNFLLVNECGDFQYVTQKQFNTLLGEGPLEDLSFARKLESNQFISRGDLSLPIELMATKYRTRKGFLRNFTALHMLVVTVRCNQKCAYCQVSSEAEDAYKFDMQPETARRIVDFIFQSPSQDIKIEFQGGEPLLNWKTVVAAIEYAEQLNQADKKRLEFVLCTNLTLITSDQLHYLKDHNVAISTSLDGDRDMHDKYRRLRTGGGTYDLFLEKLDLARKIHGNNISALMATTRCNLHSLDKVVDEYVRLGFHGVFFRALNPFGFAAENAAELSYPPEEFVEAFSHGLDHIIALNLGGLPFLEYYTALLLQRILTPYPTGFVDLQSPAGTGICGVIYDYNGDVYPADEARMLAIMGDKYFQMGNVLKDSYAEIFLGPTLRRIVEQSCVETLPGCGTCAYQLYCGADPIRNYLERGDIVGHRPTSSLCKKHRGLFDMLFKKIRYASEDELDLFWAWATGRNFTEVRG